MSFRGFPEPVLLHILRHADPGPRIIEVGLAKAPQPSYPPNQLHHINKVTFVKLRDRQSLEPLFLPPVNEGEQVYVKLAEDTVFVPKPVVTTYDTPALPIPRVSFLITALSTLTPHALATLRHLAIDLNLVCSLVPNTHVSAYLPLLRLPNLHTLTLITTGYTRNVRVARRENESMGVIGRGRYGFSGLDDVLPNRNTDGIGGELDRILTIARDDVRRLGLGNAGWMVPVVKMKAKTTR
ncbi:hypothetical protein BJ875DRAFT_541094 [Amylocarpus encephaloides]|uniref:Uncharacterized protein n=1 Tax=Amylocarpus encephaloides TaxID=45428 RepID=A0A9P8C7E6_9HELO|nr:hypothetical protein BJ875DRAFT_541094 [Amylocarpus encephaloides]